LLPSIYFSDDPKADLEAYAGLYLQQEIVAEGVTRNIPAFSRFLKIAALCNGTIVNFTNVANDAQVPRTTVYEYFEILKDTLLLGERARKGSLWLLPNTFFLMGVSWLPSRGENSVQERPNSAKPSRPTSCMSFAVTEIMYPASPLVFGGQPRDSKLIS
jgi:hypothetical protein